MPASDSTSRNGLAQRATWWSAGRQQGAMPDLVLYDGVCGLCNRLNQFILRRDLRDRFRFAALQSALGTEALRRHGRDARDLDTVYFIADYGGPGERLHTKARAVLLVLRTLGGVWRAARLLELLPSWLLEASYDFVASRRYQLFGRSESCFAPPPEYRSKFLDDLGTPGSRGASH